MGGLTLASENIGALLLKVNYRKTGGIITVSIPLFHYPCCNYIAGGTFIFYCFYRSVNLPWIALTGGIYGMVFLYVASQDHGRI